MHTKIKKCAHKLELQINVVLQNKREKTQLLLGTPKARSYKTLQNVA